MPWSHASEVRLTAANDAVVQAAPRGDPASTRSAWPSRTGTARVTIARARSAWPSAT